MKLINMTIMVVTFLFSIEAAHAAPGPMAKADIREGQLICQSGQRQKNGSEQRAREQSKEQASAPANAQSAL
jgi:hypothetical protein